VIACVLLYVVMFECFVFNCCVICGVCVFVCVCIECLLRWHVVFIVSMFCVCLFVFVCMCLVCCLYFVFCDNCFLFPL
jgi:hypothetical protein